MELKLVTLQVNTLIIYQSFAEGIFLGMCLGMCWVFVSLLVVESLGFESLMDPNKQFKLATVDEHFID